MVRKYWTKARLKTNRARTQSNSSMPNFWDFTSLRCLRPFVFADTYISVLDWYHFLYAALLSRCLTALASPPFSWGLHCQLDFTFPASHNGLSGPLGLSRSYAGMPPLLLLDLSDSQTVEGELMTPSLLRISCLKSLQNDTA